MINNLAIFKNENFGEIRTVVINDEPYFCLIDICNSLEIKNSRDCKGRLKQDGVATADVADSLGRKQETTFVNEQNLYKCIFQSRTEKAESFQDWISGEVLPQIRKNGMYAKIPKTYSEALRVLANEFEQKELMQKQRDESIKTKAYISDKKTATAMATASVKSRENEKLKVSLDLSMAYATVKRVERETGRKYDWKQLKSYCEHAGLGWNKAYDENYSSVNSYPAEAWENIYGVKL